MYSNEQLQAFIKGEIIGESYPYNTQNEEEVEAYIKQLYYWIKRIPNMICEAEFDHYGSGYSSLPGQINILNRHEKFNEMMYQLFKVLTEFGYESLDKEYANHPFPFEADIPMIYREPHEYRVLDALFFGKIN